MANNTLRIRLPSDRQYTGTLAMGNTTMKVAARHSNPYIESPVVPGTYAFKCIHALTGEKREHLYSACGPKIIFFEEVSTKKKLAIYAAWTGIRLYPSSEGITVSGDDLQDLIWALEAVDFKVELVIEEQELGWWERFAREKVHYENPYEDTLKKHPVNDLVTA